MNETNDNPETEHEDLGPLYESGHATDLERADRQNPIPGGEPPCPVCNAKTTRLVQEHPSPHMGDSPFRVRLVCSNAECRRWTLYNW
jgi:hypothetical protein